MMLGSTPPPAEVILMASFVEAFLAGKSPEKQKLFLANAARSLERYVESANVRRIGDAKFDAQFSANAAQAAEWFRTILPGAIKAG